MSVVDIRKVRLPSDKDDSQTSLYSDKASFNPRRHREPKQPISARMAYFNVLRTCFGAGALGLPLATSQAGIVLGPILSFGIGLLIIHTHKLTIVAVFMIMSQLGICSVFVLFTADSLKDILDLDNINSALLALLVPYLLLEFLSKNFARISHVSMAGNIMALIGIILTFYHIFADPHGEYFAFKFTTLSLLTAIGTFFFNMSAVGVVLSVDKNLHNPDVMVSRFGALNVGGGVAVVVCTVFGALGYWSFGTMEENILRSLPYDDTSAMVAIGLYLVAVAFTYPLQCYPGVQIMIEVMKNYERDEPISEETLKTFEKIARPIFVLTTFLISYIVPFQGPFVAFVGNLCTTLLSVVFPAAMELCLLYPKNFGKCRFYLYKNVILIVGGLISWFFGVVFSIYMIYVRILSSKSNEYNFIY